MATKVKLIADGVITPDQITLTTASTGTNTTAPATTAFVQQEISALVDSSPEALNTLNELAAALGDDANFSTTVTNSIATKAPLASPTFTGTLTASGLVYPTSDGTNGQVLTTDGAGTLSFSTVSGTTINNNADNRIITGSGTANTLNGESTLTFDGSNLNLNTTSPTLTIESGSSQDSKILFREDGGSAVSLFYEGSAGTGQSNNLHIRRELSGSETNLVTFGLDGDVGIGGSPDTKLHIIDTSPKITLTRTSDFYYGQLTSDGFSAFTNTNSSAPIIFNTGTSERMRIDSAGNVGINTYNPTARLHVEGNSYLIGAGYGIIGNNDATNYSIYNSTTGGFLDINWYGGIKFLTAGGSERMRITSTGNVGIGTTSPDSTAKLHIKSDSEGTSGDAVVIIEADQDNNNENDNPRLEFWQDGRLVKMRMGYDDNDFQMVNEYGGGQLEFGTANAIRMTVADNGNVHINKTAVNQTTTLGFDLYANGTMLSTHTVSNNESWILNNYNGSGSSRFDFRWNNSSRGGIIVTSTATSFATSSDYRLKENIEYDWDAITRLKQLKPARFNWISDDTDTLIDGFIAHEVTSIAPNAVEGIKDEVYDSEHELAGEPKYQQVDHSKLVPLLTKALQEQQTIIEDLQARIEILEG